MKKVSLSILTIVISASAIASDPTPAATEVSVLPFCTVAKDSDVSRATDAANGELIVKLNNPKGVMKSAQQTRPNFTFSPLIRVNYIIVPPFTVSATTTSTVAEPNTGNYDVTMCVTLSK